MKIKINNNDYIVNNDEFNIINHNEYTNLKIVNELGLFERLISFFCECRKMDNGNISKIVFINPTHGGFIPLNCYTYFEKLFIYANLENSHLNNYKKNVNNYHDIDNIFLHDICDIYESNNSNNKLNNSIIFCENTDFIDFTLLDNFNHILVTKKNSELINNNKYSKYYELRDTDYVIYLNEPYVDKFIYHFRFYINEYENVIYYDNLINLCIMVKNAGPQFEEMLLSNIDIIDKWTILDTGSSDNTIDIINNALVGKKSGNLYQEPFINFCDSRNRLLELAGESCKFILMLDDTYVMKGNIRQFLNEIRGDQYSNSFTLMINSHDTQYGSNRIIKSNSGLKYMYKIHEVITDKNNINIVVPENKASILDKRYDYMEARTMERKKIDLSLLFEELEDDPMNPRTYYYLAQTYNLLKDYEKAFEYFIKRTEFVNSGFLQERVDAAFEAARLANFQLNKPWDECLTLYEKCYKMDESRPESLYFIGIHYYVKENPIVAYNYFKQAFQLGFPTHCQYSLKPTLSYHFLPKFLVRVCYEMEDYKLGQSAAELFLTHNNFDADSYEEMVSWLKIYEKLNIYNGPKTPVNPTKPIFCFVADGGFHSWSGSNILTTGVGGSETYIIEMARWIEKSGHFNVIVFCNTPDELDEIFEGVQYVHLKKYYEFVNTNYIHTCIVSRFSEYLPVTFKGWTENVYLVVHDLTTSGIVIPIDKKLKNIFCLSEWHVTYFTTIFPQLKDITVPFYYGCNFSPTQNNNKIPYSFIYSSFPNRGLLELLQMWPDIYMNEPLVTLNIYSDIYNKWSNETEPEKMEKIKRLLDDYSKRKNGLGIKYHGWVNKSALEEAWKKADIWFYPCTFMETFCLTALEAALSKTFVITNNLAALQNTVSDRGVIINGNPTTKEWQNDALIQIARYLNPSIIQLKNKFIERNYKWAEELTWERQSNKLLNEYVLQNKLEYKGMYNWTNNVPFGTKEQFINVIHYFNSNYTKVKTGQIIRVLEIGTYTGISLINIVNLIPNSYGIGVDTWTNYNENNLLNNIDELQIEESFYKNINLEGFIERIKGIKNDSTNQLFKFIDDKTTFDFIYIDGSHLLLDCYTDIVLAWKILERGGIMGIDDYTYKKDTVLESPFEAINYFLKRYVNEYRLIHKGYRVFIEKI